VTGNFFSSHKSLLNKQHSVFYSSSTFLAASNVPYKHPWIIEAGATDHMVNSIKIFTTITAVVSSHVKLPNGQVALVTHIETVKISDSLLLTNVLRVPFFTFNFVSASKLLKNIHYYLIFIHKFCFMQNLTSWETIGVGEEKHGLFYLVQTDSVSSVSSAFSISNVSENIWHYHLGHLSSSRLNLIHASIPNISINSKYICTICPLAKQKRLPFPISTSVSDLLFELLHCDLLGPFFVKSNNGSFYFLTIVDDHSHFTWVFLMKQKSQTRSLLQFFINLVETQFPHKVKCLRTDNGLEFLMSEFFASKGILHQHSCVESPQQSTIVERKHQHLLNVARALRFQAHLPLSFWGECVLTTTHIINRIPAPLLFNKSPFELLFQKSPTYSCLQVFGCLCYASTLIRSRYKFDPRAKPCIFLGYLFGVKGYILFDLSTKTSFISQDVVFHESIFPYASNLLRPTADGCFVFPLPSTDFSHTSTFDSVVPSLPLNPAQSPPNDNSQPSLPLPRRSTRISHPLAYLKDFHCQVVTSPHPQLSLPLVVSTPPSGIKYPLSSVIAYHKLSNAHLHFSMSVSSVSEPQFYHQAVKNPLWRQTMQAEINALKENKTWILVDLPPNKKPIGCRWVYKVKYKSNEKIERYNPLGCQRIHTV
jgi:hypothetical protein